MRSHLLWAMVGSLVQVPIPLKGFYAEIMRRKHDDWYIVPTLQTAYYIFGAYIEQ